MSPPVSAAAAPLADADARHQLLHDLDSTFVVEAAAGTGKTTVLVDRIVAMVRSGRARLSETVAVTFTEKAAGEMKLRLRARLERARLECASASPEQARLTKALEELEVARISTIHGLCADVLREHPVEAGVDPLFGVATEADARGLLQLVFQRELQSLLAQKPEGVRRALRRRPHFPDAQSPRQALFSAVQSLVERRDFDGAWARPAFDRASALESTLAALQRLAKASTLVPVRLQESRNAFWKPIERVRQFVDEQTHRETVAARDLDGLEAQLRDLVGPAYEWSKRLPSGLDLSVSVARDEALQALTDFNRLAEADLAACLHAELRPIVAAYEVEKARVGVLDFVDLLLKVRDLLMHHRSVRERLQRGIKALFVDEFQDTDPLQSEIVLLLAAADGAQTEAFEASPVPGKLFVVGDPKQSIYRFRRADILLYQRVKAHLLAHGGKVLYLSTSFRSTPGIQAAVNAAFGPAMQGEHQATWVSLERFRPINAAQPSVIALPAPRPFPNPEKEYVSKPAIEAGVADAVGAFIHWLVTQSGWKVEDEGQLVPVEPRHVCILFKRMRNHGQDVALGYAQALELRKVPHVLVGGRSFHDREEVMALRTALLAIDRPDDELSVYATLRGPLFALTDDALLAFKAAAGKLHPLRPFGADEVPAELREVVEALAVLSSLHRQRNERPVASTIHALLEATRAHAGIAAWTAGSQALANVLQLAEVSRVAERRASSFRHVIEALQDDAEERASPEAPISEEGTEGVRMMTVHGAKGLEFPVVILAEPTCNATHTQPSHWLDPARKVWVHAIADCRPIELRAHEAEVLERDAEEALRLGYVAATRAKDLLVVPICSEKSFEGSWTHALRPALWPGPSTFAAPLPAPGCPAFGRDPIVGRSGPVPDQVPWPGRHLAASGSNGVVWWDANVLTLSLEERTGLEIDEALKDDPTEGPKSVAAFEAWSARREASLAAGARQALTVTLARDLAPVLVSGTVQIEQTDARREGRPGGRRFGSLVHAALAKVPLRASRDQVQHVVSVLARSLSATSAEQVAAVEAVEAALRHPRLEAARRAEEVRFEMSVIGHPSAGHVIEGTVDLAYRLDGVWHLVEFKTDETLDEATRAAYESQVQAYLTAVGAATGVQPLGVILRV